MKLNSLWAFLSYYEIEYARWISRKYTTMCVLRFFSSLAYVVVSAFAPVFLRLWTEDKKKKTEKENVFVEENDKSTSDAE